MMVFVTNHADADKQAPRLLYTPTQAAVLLGLGRSTIYELMKAGALKSVHVGRARRIKPEYLAAFVEGLRADAQ